MLLHLTEKSEVPLHSQIIQQLTNKIIEGDLLDGAELDSIRKLATSQRVSMNTVKRAYEELEQDGLIISPSGKGFYVARLTPKQKQKIVGQRLWGNLSLLNMVESFSKQLISVFDQEHLRRIVEENLKEHLMVKHVFIVNLDNRTNDYTILPSKEINDKCVIPKNDNLLKIISKLSLPIKVETMLSDNQNGTLIDELNRRNIELIVPLKYSGQLIGFIALSSKVNRASYSTHELNLLQVLANQFVTALTTARFYVEAIEKRRIDEELLMARQIQADLFPKELPDNELFSIAAYCSPSKVAGGDFYDYISIDKNRFAIVIADACGKGMPAAMLISQIQAMLKSEINNGNDIRQTLENLNKQMVLYTPKDRFVTLFLGEYDTKCNEFKYATAGHEYPILVRKDGKLLRLESGGPALGIIERAIFETGRIKVNPGDSIILFTDGVTETMNPEKKIYSVERLCKLLVKNNSLSSDHVLQKILDDLGRFSEDKIGLDDRTILVFKINKLSVDNFQLTTRKR